MNGLANGILTMLLSWLRIIVNRIWSLVNSETGSLFFTFLANNWVKILLVLGVGGFLVDKLIYLIRWRPFSVRRRRRQQQAEEALATQEDWPQQPVYNPYAQPQMPAYTEPMPEPEPEILFDSEQPAMDPWPEPIYEMPANDPTAASTVVYTPAVADHSAYRPPMDDIEPVFDEPATWAGSDAWMSTPEPLAPMPSATYPPMPEQVAGHAQLQPPPPLFAPIEPPVTPPPAEVQPVHPGLDTELLRRNMGLGYNDDASPADDPYAEEPLAVNFTPFTRQAEMEQPAKKSRNPFMNLMRLVGDEAAKPSIHDLQSSVDVRNAFREPVYPKPLHRNEDDPS